MKFLQPFQLTLVSVKQILTMLLSRSGSKPLASFLLLSEKFVQSTATHKDGKVVEQFYRLSSDLLKAGMLHRHC